MQIPEPDNAASAMVDGEMWNRHTEDGSTTWTSSGASFDEAGFEAYLDQAQSVVFYSPIGRVIQP